MSEQVFDFLPAKEKERLMGMSFDALNSLLVQVTDMPDSAQKNAYIEWIMEVIAEKDDNPYILSDDFIRSEKEDFYENYCGKKMNAETDDAPESLPFFASSGKKPKKKPLYRILRGVALAAAVAVLLCCFASAFGYHVFDIFAKWGDGILVFIKDSASPDTEPHPAFAELYEEVSIYTDLPLVPKSCPHDVTLLEKNIIVTAPHTSVSFSYETAQGQLNFSYKFHPENSIFTSTYEIKDDSVDKYDYAEVTHYISENTSQISIVWFCGNVECNIWGDLTYEEAIEMVESIY